jgi:undecaprenyl-diphosphatase
MLKHRIPLVAFGIVLLAAALAAAMAHLDRKIMEALYFRPPALLPVMKVITMYGSWFVLLPAGVLAMIFAMHYHRLDLAIRLGAGMAAGVALTEGLKVLVERTRPDFLQRVSISGSSFPSGHALDSVVVWSFIVLLVASAGYTERWVRVLFVIPLLVGWSRVYLGAHWPSDVLGGWGLGLIVLAAIGGGRPTSARVESFPRP